jgi:hypothetical protein
MSAEMFAHITRNAKRDDALVANAPDNRVMESVVTNGKSSGNDQVLDIISELLKRRQP